MLTVAALVAAVAFSFFYLVIWPFFYYLYDPKGLRKYPNYSPLSGATDLSFCYLSFRGFRSKALYEAHKQAPILRIGPNSLSFGRLDAVRDIYGHSTKCEKDLNYVVLSGSHTHLIDSVDREEHARKRKLLSAAFAIKNLMPWEFKVADSTSRLLKAFDQRCTEPLANAVNTPSANDLNIDFNKWINLFTIEAINSIALSSRLGLLEQGNDEVTAERMDGTTYRARYRQAQNQTSYAQATFVWSYAWYEWLARFSTVIPWWRQVWREAEPWNDVVYHQAVQRHRREQAGEKLDDFFSCLMNGKAGQPNNLPWGEIVAEVSVIINAGADTTAIALSHVMYQLIKHPDVLQKLREEVDNALEEDEVVAPYDKVRNLPYLRACLDESLRLVPPTSAGLARRTPREGAQILDQWIPGDTGVSMTIYAAHRDEAVFPDPEEFRPSRWLDPEDRKKLQPFFIPFSTGSRGCIGRNISYLEQAVVVASLVHRYDFAFPSPDWQVKRHEAFNILVGEMPMKIWRRNVLKD